MKGDEKKVLHEVLLQMLESKSHDPGYVQAICEALTNGVIPAGKLEESARRIKAMQERYGSRPFFQTLVFDVDRRLLEAARKKEEELKKSSEEGDEHAVYAA